MRALVAGLVAAASALVPAAAAHAQALSPGWLPPLRIAVVYPHDENGPAPVASARLANVSVWPTSQVPCGALPNPGVLLPRLMVATGNEPARFLEGPPRLASRTVGAATFPSLEWNDVPVDPAQSARFLVYAIGVPIGGGFYSNVWAHAADARTLLPQPVAPEDVASPGFPPEGIDARIQIVWPHDAQGQPAPTETAGLVNVAVDLFVHGTRRALPAEMVRSYAVKLLVAAANEPFSTVDGGKSGTTTYQASGRTIPRWTFDDVPVKPGQPHHFVVSAVAAGGRLASPYSTVWTHASDPRTVQPNPPPPPSCAQ